jgi:hypothetical protein
LIIEQNKFTEIILDALDELPPTLSFPAQMPDSRMKRETVRDA